MYAIRTAITTVLGVVFALGSLSGAADDVPEWLGEDVAPSMDDQRSRPAPPGRRGSVPGVSGPLLEEFLLDDGPEVDLGATGDADFPSAADEPVGSRYEIQPSDILVVSVWREPELLREVTVSPDGWITFPLVGEVFVEGSTISAIRADIETRVRRYINRAVVNVTLKQTLGNRVYVLGKVNNPGVFPFSKKLNVMQALSLAGGVSKFAATDNIKIIRETDSEEQQAFRFNYGQVRRGRRLTQNIYLRSGDVVMVP